MAGSEKTWSRLPRDIPVACPFCAHQLIDEVFLRGLALFALSGPVGAVCRGRGAQQKAISEGAASWSPRGVAVLTAACRAPPSGKPDGKGSSRPSFVFRQTGLQVSNARRANNQNNTDRKRPLPPRPTCFPRLSAGESGEGGFGPRAPETPGVGRLAGEI